MKLSAEQVRHIAQLARLDFTDDELEKYSTELSAILSYVARLGELPTDTTDTVEPTTHITAQLSSLRSDEVVSCSQRVRDAIIAAFPQSRDNLLVVPAVFHSYKE